MTGPLIEARGLRKDFAVRVRVGRWRRATRHVAAVDGVDLRVEAGETLGYIGPNGAGKSTTLKMLTGVLFPSAGSVRVCGLEPVPQRVRLARQIGVVFGQRSQLWWDLPLRDSFDLLRHIYRVPTAAHAARLRRCADLLDLGAFLDVPVRQLSLGQRMRGELTAALLHGPRVLFLDEPTIGLDVVSKQAVRGFLDELGAAIDICYAAGGGTIWLSEGHWNVTPDELVIGGSIAEPVPMILRGMGDATIGAFGIAVFTDWCIYVAEGSEVRDIKIDPGDAN